MAEACRLLGRRWVTLVYGWLVLMLLSSGVACLRLLHVGVPPVLLRGETASLVCEYELGGDRLYSVTWYKDHDEIYRFVPRAAMPKHSYVVDGVHVDRHGSDERRVVLRSVNLKSSGNYRCEVSAEAPSFSSVHGEGRLEVVALPQRGPEITGLERPEYQIGDTLSVNCTSDRSYPPAQLRWYINDRQVDPTHEAQMTAHGLVRSQARLVVRVGPQHFKDGHMALRCVATIRPPQHQAAAHAAHAPAATAAVGEAAPVPAPSKHGHRQQGGHQGHQSHLGHLGHQGHQPLPRIAMEIDNREAKALVKSGASSPAPLAALLLALLVLLAASS